MATTPAPSAATSTAAPLHPLKIVPIRIYRGVGTGTHTMTLWAQDSPTDCAAHSHGQAVVEYFRQHPCRGLSRHLWTMPFHGRTLALAIESIVAQPGPRSPNPGVHLEYEWATQLVKLENTAGTGSINDLVMEGHRVPDFAGTVIPANEAFHVDCQDDGVVVFDAWYVDGPTTLQDPELIDLEDGLFLTPATEFPYV